MFYSCNMDTSDLPEMYPQSPRVQPKDCNIYISDKSKAAKLV